MYPMRNGSYANLRAIYKYMGKLNESVVKCV